MSGGSGVVPRALHRLEPLAPDWLVRIVAPKPAPTPWPDMIRVAVTITGALLAGVLTGQTGIGGLAAMGALTGAFGDQGGPFPQRVRRISAGVAGALAGLLLGRLLLPAGWLGVPFLALAGVASAYLSAVGAVASFAGLQFLVMLAVANGLGSTVPLGPLLAAFALGAVWALALSAVQSVVRPDRTGPRHAVAAAVDRLGDLVAAVRDRAELDAARTALSAALASGFDAVTTARATSSGRRDDLRRLAGVLGAMPEVARATVADAGDPALAAAAARITRVRHRVATGAPAPVTALPAIPDARVERALTRMERLAGAPDAGSRPVGRGRRAPREVAADLAERLSGRGNRVFAVRLGLTLAAAETLRVLLPLPHSYWLLLTAAVVLKPDLGSVFARGVQRTLGTLVGVGIGVAVLNAVPRGPLLLVPVAVLALLFPVGAKRNYGMLATFITPLVLILVDLSGGVTKGLAVTRLIDTLLGAAVVLLVGYLPWPSTWRPRIGHDVAATVDALAAYAAVAVDGPDPAIGPSRRRAYAALQDLRGDLQAALAEPPPRSRYAAAWWPVVGSLEQLADDLRDASLLDRAGVFSGASGSGRVVTALREIASAMRARRVPAATPLPESGVLSEAGADVRGLRRLLEGPARSG